METFEDKLLRIEKQKMAVQILNSQQKADLYHFKVMELQTHEDTKGESILRLRFHFLFDMIRKVERSHLRNMNWDISSNPIQNLYLSKDTTRLMEVTNNCFATVYIRQNIDEKRKFQSQQEIQEYLSELRDKKDCG